jgi:Ca2+-binding RTX toxin-like protein
MTNTGTVAGRGFGVQMEGLGVSLMNSGTISAVSPGAVSIGVHLVESVGAHLANSGLVEATGSAESAGLQLFGASQMTVMNEGTIRSTTGYGIRVEDAATLVLNNLGVISGNAGFRPAVQGGAQADVVTNRGTMVGDVTLGAGDDTFDGAGGTVLGEVAGGAGNDTYIIDAYDFAIREAAGAGTGVDTIRSMRDFSLAVTPDVENLTLLGMAVTGAGNAKNNVITGNAAANRLDGSAGGDRIDGAQGDDDIRGGTGRDSLTGGEGDDTLRGGADNDRLTGGADADIFVFGRAADTGNTAATRDIITDFAPGEDLIDLSRIDANANAAGNQAFAFIGGAAFGSVAGQLRFATVSGAQVLEGDRDGNGSADFQIELSGVSALSQADILL